MIASPGQSPEAQKEIRMNAEKIITNKKALPWIGIWLLAFTGAMTSVKFIESASVYQVAALRFLCGTLVVAMLLWKNRITPFATKRFPLHFLNATCRALAVYCTYYAYGTLLLTFAAAIGYTRPLMAMGLAILLLKEKPHWHRWLAVFLGYGGVYLILDPTGEDWNWGLVSAVAANVLASFSQICSKKLTKTESNLTIMFFENALPLFISIAIGLYFWVTPTFMDYGFLLAVALLGTLSQFSYIQSIRQADVSFVSPFEYLRLILAAPVGYLVFQETLTPEKAFGSVLILIASWFLTRPEKPLSFPIKVS